MLKAVGDRCGGIFGVDEKKAKRGQLGWFVFIALVFFPQCILLSSSNNILFCRAKKKKVTLFESERRYETDLVVNISWVGG